MCAALLIAACQPASRAVPPTTASERISVATAELDPCALLSRAFVTKTLGTDVTEVRELGAENFHSPPPPDSVTCAYETTSAHFGQLIVGVQPMTHAEYRSVFVERDPVNVGTPVHVGEEAYFDCGSVIAYSQGRVLQVGVQYADCDARRELVTLARVALAALEQGGLRSSPPAFVRRCDTSVYGDLGSGWKRNSLEVGPVSFVGLGDLDAVSPSFPEPTGGGPQKVLAVVETGPPVTVTIAPSSEVTLLYDPAAFNRARNVSDGDASVRFVPCGAASPHPEAGPRETQFSGGFFVEAPVCASIEVSRRGAEPASAQVPLGGGSCS